MAIEVFNLPLEINQHLEEGACGAALNALNCLETRSGVHKYVIANKPNLSKNLSLAIKDAVD